jgi:hypothetical protein
MSPFVDERQERKHSEVNSYFYILDVISIIERIKKWRVFNIPNLLGVRGTLWLSREYDENSRSTLKIYNIREIIPIRKLFVLLEIRYRGDSAIYIANVEEETPDFILSGLSKNPRYTSEIPSI